MYDWGSGQRLFHFRWWRYWLNPAMYGRRLKWFWQRGSRGWSDRDLWSFGDYLARVIAPALVRFKETGHGHPCDLTPESWDAKLDTMIAGFRAAAAFGDGPPDRFFEDDPTEPLGLRIPDSQALREWETDQLALFRRGGVTFLWWYFHLWD